MNRETSDLLRKPFAGKEVGKLPKITCQQCSKSPTRNCDRHNRSQCGTCGNYITSQHMHIDYVGHAEVTDRLLAVDPTWNWEPVAWDERGLPRIDGDGGLWIRLTVAGVTRLGYGHADGKKTADALKVAIGDALRNAAMRFGVALDLWGATYDPPTVEADEHDAPEGPILATQHETIRDLWEALGYGGDEHKPARMNIAAQLLGIKQLHTFTSLTQAQANDLIAALRDRLDKTKGGQA